MQRGRVAGRAPQPNLRGIRENLPLEYLVGAPPQMLRSLLAPVLPAVPRPRQPRVHRLIHLWRPRRQQSE